jgi:hypothetical protein
MRLSKPFVFACAAICAGWFISPISNAQEATPLSLNAPTSPGGSGAPNSTTLAPPAGAMSLSEPSVPPSEPATNDDAENPIYGCACGCGIFEVGAASMFPHSNGRGMLYLEYDYQDQNINWSGVRPAPGSANDDKNLRTSFVTLGLQYFFNQDWGIQIELPYDNRSFQTVSAAPGSPVTTLQWSAFGDLRLQGIYTGLSEDKSIGLTFGAKLPTGNYTHNNKFGDVDRDSELGTGCVDLLAGGFFRHQFTDVVTGFTQLAIDAPVDEVSGYRPGLEADAAVGAYFTGFHLGHVHITPVAQVLLSERGHDCGPAAAHPLASGYQRLLLSPGLEVDLHPFSIYADIEVPAWQHFTGDQLTAPFLCKVILSYNF